MNNPPIGGECFACGQEMYDDPATYEQMDQVMHNIAEYACTILGDELPLDAEGLFRIIKDSDDWKRYVHATLFGG